MTADATVSTVVPESPVPATESGQSSSSSAQTASPVELSEAVTSPEVVPEAASTSTESVVEELTRQLAAAEQKATANWDNLLRKQAELDNVQKRMAREIENAHKYALEKFAIELLEVKDSLELGIEAANKPETDLGAVKEGMMLILKKLADTLKKFNILEINPQDEKFNPQWHEAIAVQPVQDQEDNTVLLVHQKGYQLNDRLLRPARVVVAKAVQSN